MFECDREASIIRRSLPTRVCSAMGKEVTNVKAVLRYIEL